MNEVMEVDKKDHYFLEPMIEAACVELDKLDCDWTTAHIRRNIRKLQKNWVIAKAMEDWAFELETTGEPMGKFLALELRRRMHDA